MTKEAIKNGVNALVRSIHLQGIVLGLNEEWERKKQGQQFNLDISIEKFNSFETGNEIATYILENSPIFKEKAYLDLL